MVASLGTANGSDVFATTTTLVPIPAWVVQGALLAIALVFTANQNNVDVKSTGWVATAVPAVGPQDNDYIFYRIATAGDQAAAGSGNWTFNITDGFILVWALEGWSGENQASPFLPTPPTANNGFSVSRVGNSVVSPAAGTTFIMVLCSEANSGANSTPAGMALDVISSSGFSDIHSYIFSQTVGAGATGTRTSTAAAGFGWETLTYCINPAAASVRDSLFFGSSMP